MADSNKEGMVAPAQPDYPASNLIFEHTIIVIIITVTIVVEAVSTLGFTYEMEFEYAAGVFFQVDVGIRCDRLIQYLSHSSI